MAFVNRTPNISRSKLSNTQKVMLEKHDAIVLVNGTTPFNEDFYVYLKVNKPTFEKIHQDHKTGGIVNIFEYGDVLEFGSGITPPEEVTQRVKKKHGDPSKPWWN